MLSINYCHSNIALKQTTQEKRPKYKEPILLNILTSHDFYLTNLPIQPTIDNNTKINHCLYCIKYLYNIHKKPFFLLIDDNYITNIKELFELDCFKECIDKKNNINHYYAYTYSLTFFTTLHSLINVFSKVIKNCDNINLLNNSELLNKNSNYGLITDKLIKQNNRHNITMKIVFNDFIHHDKKLYEYSESHYAPTSFKYKVDENYDFSFEDSKN